LKDSNENREISTPDLQEVKLPVLPHEAFHSFGEIWRTISTFTDLFAELTFSEILRASRQVLWQSRASADTFFAFIPVLLDGAFCEGG